MAPIGRRVEKKAYAEGQVFDVLIAMHQSLEGKWELEYPIPAINEYIMNGGEAGRVRSTLSSVSIHCLSSPAAANPLAGSSSLLRPCTAA